MKKLLLLFGVVALMGCNVQQRQIARMQDYAVRYPGPFKVLAAQLDPCFSGVAKADTTVINGKADTSVSYIKGLTVYAGKELTGRPVNTDDAWQTMPLMPFDSTATITKVVTIRIPITKTITDTLTDQRQIASLSYMLTGANDSLRTVKTQLAALQKEESKFKLWFWLLAGILILSVAIYCGISIYKLIYGGAAVKAGTGIVDEAEKLL